jgi:GT2 family glycosyltransferase
MAHNRNQQYLASFIIVNWNTKELTAQCIRSVLDKNRTTPIEVLLVDNASTDGSIEFLTQKFPMVKIIRNDKNLGFARATNQAIRLAAGNLIILLNSDAELLSQEPVQRIRSFLQMHPQVGIVGGKLLLPSGRVQSLGREAITLKSLIKTQLFFSSAPVLHKFRSLPHDAYLPADYVDGAFLAIRKKVVNQIGLLNESYFMYAEDMEWCTKAKKVGWHIAVLPEVKVLHHHAQSSIQNFAEILLHNAVNISRYMAKNDGIGKAWLAFVILMAGMILRIPLSMIRKPQLTGDYWRGFKKCLKLAGRLDTIVGAEK